MTDRVSAGAPRRRGASLGRVLLGCALFLLPVAAASDARASVSIAVAFDALVKDADGVALITPVDAQSVWEDGRIFTYTKVKIDQPVAGEVGGAGAEGYVRTMGGVVGKIGQMVDGEPVFVSGKSSLLFLRKLKAGNVFEVSERAQGQYPLILDEVRKSRKIVRSANAGMLLPPRNASAAGSSSQVQTQSVSGATEIAKVPMRIAQEVMHDRPVDDAAREIATAWRRLHPAPTK